MTPFQVCVCYLIRTRPDGSREVLLGRKKRGLGTGKIVGLGGKLEPDESPLDAIVREVEEESGILLRPEDVLPRGFIRYSFPFRESWSQNSHPFVVERFDGEPEESDEIDPRWFPVDDLPVKRMWDDAKHWLPTVLAGGSVDAWFEFAEDCESVADSRIRVQGL